MVRDGLGRPTSVLCSETEGPAVRDVGLKAARAQRLESIGEMASGVAHDLNNVLQPIMMTLDMLDQLIVDPKQRQWLSLAAQSAARGAELLRGVLTFGEALPNDLRDVIREAWGVAVADQISASSVLQLAHLSDEVMRRLDELLPSRWSKSNPIDSAGGETRETVESIFELLLSSSEVDSVVFLTLAFGSLQFIEGQIIGKFWMTTVAAGAIWLLRRRYPQTLLAPAVAQ
mgnify:CR=1 FL=1